MRIEFRWRRAGALSGDRLQDSVVSVVDGMNPPAAVVLEYCIEVGGSSFGWETVKFDDALDAAKRGRG